MKKILCLLTALVCVFSIVACDLLGIPSGGEVGNPLEDVVAASKPTEVVTQVTYSYPTQSQLSEFNGKLNGFYVLKNDGENSILEYEYRTLAKPEELEPDGIKVISGTFYCFDGKTSVDGDEWDVVSADTVNVKLELVKGRFKTYEKSEDEKTLTATITGQNIESIIGHRLSADGDVSFVVKTNGIYLTGIEISYTALSGASVVINTSYTYNELDLEFPAN